VTLASEMFRFFGKRRWLDALRRTNPALATEAVRILDGEAKADRFLEQRHTDIARYLKRKNPDISEAELNQLSWNETVASLPAQLVPRTPPNPDHE
jgi:hypothetical protein